MKKYVDENGVEWAEFADYKMAVINGTMVVAPVAGVTVKEAEESFLADMTALDREGLIRLALDGKQHEGTDQDRFSG